MPDPIAVSLNGSNVSIHEPATVGSLLQDVAIDGDQRGIAVAVNDRVVRRASWNTHVLADGDRVDMIHATQGG